MDTCFNALRYVSWYCTFGDGANQPFDLKANLTTELNFILAQTRKKRFVPDSLSIQVPDLQELFYNKTELVYNEVLKKIYWDINKKLDFLAWKKDAKRFEFQFRK